MTLFWFGAARHLGLPPPFRDTDGSPKWEASDEVSAGRLQRFLGSPIVDMPEEDAGCKSGVEA